MLPRYSQPLLSPPPSPSLVSSFSDKKFTLVPLVLAIFPFTYLVSPIVGLLAYSFGLLVWWRRYLSILIASILPAVIAVLIYALFYASLTSMEMYVVTTHVIVKMLLSVFAQQHIAMIIVGNDKRKRKRLRKHGGDAFSETGLSPIFSLAG